MQNLMSISLEFMTRRKRQEIFSFYNLLSAKYETHLEQIA